MTGWKKKKIFWVSQQPTRMQIAHIYFATTRAALFLLHPCTFSLFFFYPDEILLVLLASGARFQICM